MLDNAVFIIVGFKNLGMPFWLVLLEVTAVINVLKGVTLDIKKPIVITLGGNASNLRVSSKIDLKPLMLITLCWYPASST